MKHARTSEAGGSLAPLLVVLGIVAAVYVGAAVYFGDRVPAGTRVGGVAVGGLTQDEARTKLQAVIDRQAKTPVTVTGGTGPISLDPKTVGLAADAHKSIDGLIGFSLNPVDLWRGVSGGGEDLPLATRSDAAALEAALTKAAPAVEKAPREGSLRLQGKQVLYTPPVVGVTFDTSATAKAILDGWPGTTTVRAVVGERAPAVPASAFESVKATVAEPVAAGPVTVNTGKASFPVPVEVMSPALSFGFQGATVTHKVDEKVLTTAVQKVARAHGLEKAAQDATVVFDEGNFSVRPAVTGQALKSDVIAKSVVAAWSTPQRTAVVPLVAVAPKVTTEQARTTIPKGLISTFTTHFPDNPVRTHNLRVATTRLNGTYVPKGGTLSLNALLGQRTAEKGYKKAQVIYDGRLAYDYGGGISQVSTTLFNAAFFAGVRIDEYLPHSFYISRYPVGREATISWPDLDNRWTNTTNGGILIKAWLSGNDITVQFYGVKTYDVESITGPRRNVVKPKRIKDDGDKCVPQAPSDGFDITVTRVIRQGGTVVKRENYNTHYIPEDEVICSKPYDPNK